MKINNLYKYLIICFGILAFADVSFAADSVPITGIAYSEKIGLVHFDYKTACLEDPADLNKCLDKNDPAYNNPDYYIGPTKQFYISPYDTYYQDPKPSFVPGKSSVATRISTKSSDCNGSNCNLLGFAWSDKLGWISFGGEVINQAIIANGVPGGLDAKWYPKINMSPVGDRVALTGLIWNEYTGWILMSSDLTGTSGVTADSDAQTKTDFGLWLDAGMDPDRIDVVTDPDLNITKTEKLGRRINGYAWSERLGWIKFSPSSSDDIDPATPGIQSDPSFTTYTLWIPDSTSPIPLAPDKLWFAPGVNTHYPDITKKPENISWEDFAMDPESGMNEKDSEIIFRAVGNNPSLCLGDPNTHLVNPLSIGRMTYPLPGAPVDYTLLGVGDVLRLIIPGLGRVQNVPDGYCKYELHAKLVNDVNMPTYIGNPSDPANDNPHPPDNKSYFDPIIVYVRAGDYSDRVPAGYTGSSVTATPGTPKAYADGNQPVNYTVDFKDVAGNPVMDVDCASTEIANYPDNDCPGREVVVTANLTNELLYDLTQPNQTQVVRPLIHGDANIGGSAVALTEADNDMGTYKSGILNWPIHKYNNNNQWDVEINRVSYSYPITLASFAPSGTFCKSERGCDPVANGTFPIIFQFNSFNYKIYNEKLPETSKKLKVPLSPTAGPPYDFDTNTATEVKACYDDNDPATPPATNPTAIDCLNPTFPTTGLLPRVGVLPTPKAGIITTQVERSVVFDPPIKTDGASISGEVAGVNVLTMSYPAELSFNISNVGPSPLLSSTDPGSGFSLDNIFQYYGTTTAGSNAAALMQTQRISNETVGDNDDSNLAWTDPFEFCHACTRYEMFMNGGTNFDTPMVGLEPKNSPFIHFFESQHGNSFRFYFNDDALTPGNTILSTEVDTKAPSLPDFDRGKLPAGYLTNEIGDNGSYAVTGLASIPQKYEPKPDSDPTTPFSYDPGYIDRSDPVAAELSAGSTISKKIRFFPEKLIPVTIGNLKFRLVQEIAYRFPTQQIYTKYAAENPILENVDVKDTGLEARGTVAGEQIVTGREFDVVGTASTRKLQEQIRRNVSELTAGVEPCELSGTETSFGTLPAVGSTCVVEDTVNSTVIAYYHGNKDQYFVLDDVAAKTINLPEQPYTLIIKGGANLVIKDNLAYPASGKPSFGIILIADKIGEGSNAFITPDPTNITAVLYAEGSLLSRSDDGKLYYGDPSSPASGNVKDLKNQLYWRGSIASRNTIAGAGQKKKPEGITCLPGDTDFSCAQRYDLDYLRRFTPIIDPTQGSIIANNGLFSGGGCCGADVTCGMPVGQCKLGSLTSLVKLDTANSKPNQIIESTSQLATVYVEKDPATVNNPPPGFTVTIGLESTQEIR